MTLFPKKVLRGCEGRGDADSPYLTRYTLLRTPFGAVFLHVFHRSDADVLHDHPWPFATLILWRGYTEITATAQRRIYPGFLLFRPATWAHRVELQDGKRAVTLVFVGRRVREWGFVTPCGWNHWVDYFRENGCGQ